MAKNVILFITFLSYTAFADFSNYEGCVDSASCSSLGLMSQKSFALRAKCMAQYFKNQCAVLKLKASPEEKANFFSCESQASTCEYEYSPSGNLISCGEGVGGVLVDAVIGIVLLPASIYETAKGIPDFLLGLGECNGNLEKKKLLLGTFRTSDMSDETLTRMTCRDIQKFTELKSKVILDRLEQRRLTESIASGKPNLEYSDMVLLEPEIQALNFTLNSKGVLGRSVCYRKSAAIKVACEELTKMALVAASAAATLRALSARAPNLITRVPTAASDILPAAPAVMAEVRPAFSYKTLPEAQKKVWNKFKMDADEAFVKKWEDFSPTGELEFDTKFHGAEGQIFLSKEAPTLGLKRFFKNVNDPWKGVTRLEDMANIIDTNPAIAKSVEVVRVHEKGPDWIIRDFEPDSVQLRDAIKDPAAIEARKALLKEIQTTTDPLLKVLVKKLQKQPISENLHWSPSKQKIIIIDLTRRDEIRDLNPKLIFDDFSFA